ncbi:MCM2/3/5 family-domain-containing protein [Russula brevipes]|nr:MCM2/3/5 family-domain-containing protein [Russula brevipes]
MKSDVAHSKLRPRRTIAHANRSPSFGAPPLPGQGNCGVSRILARRAGAARVTNTIAQCSPGCAAAMEPTRRPRRPRLEIDRQMPHMVSLSAYDGHEQARRPPRRHRHLPQRACTCGPAPGHDQEPLQDVPQRHTRPPRQDARLRLDQSTRPAGGDRVPGVGGMGEEEGQGVRDRDLVRARAGPRWSRSVWSMDDVKKGILLQLFGGTNKSIARGGGGGGPRYRGDTQCIARGHIKAGIITTLNARTSLLAAANPVGSKYNVNLPVTGNIDLPPTLISRFDLLYLVLDEVNETLDRKLAQHLVASAHTRMRLAHRHGPHQYRHRPALRKLREDMHKEVLGLLGMSAAAASRGICWADAIQQLTNQSAPRQWNRQDDHDDRGWRQGGWQWQQWWCAACT